MIDFVRPLSLSFLSAVDLPLKLEADLVGMIANRHLCIADVDEKGPECKDCLLLAEYASHAVDFPKTGTAVNFNQLPRSPNRLKPDFLSNEVTDVSTLNTSFYPSKKILGHLYRRVPLQDDEPEDRSASFGIIAGAVDALRTERLGLPSVFDLPEDVLQEMGDVLELYKTELQFIAKAHTLAKHPNDQLSEAELVSGTIQAKWADHHKRRETVASMNLQVCIHMPFSSLFKDLMVYSTDATIDEGCSEGFTEG